MQLNELDKKAIIALKDRIDELESRVNELSVMRLKNDLPLESILRGQDYYKSMVAHGAGVGERLTRELWGPKACCQVHELDYSVVLESSKTYTVDPGLVVFYAFKIIEGSGFFDMLYNGDRLFSFPVLEGEKYVLFPRAVVCYLRSSWCVKEQEGHIRYTCAMSTFLHPEIKEVK